MNGGGEATASTVLMSILECHVTHPETRVALIVSLSREREKGRDGGNNIFDARRGWSSSRQPTCTTNNYSFIFFQWLVIAASVPANWICIAIVPTSLDPSLVNEKFPPREFIFDGNRTERIFFVTNRVTDSHQLSLRPFNREKISNSTNKGLSIELGKI